MRTWSPEQLGDTDLAELGLSPGDRGSTVDMVRAVLAKDDPQVRQGANKLVRLEAQWYVEELKSVASESDRQELRQEYGNSLRTCLTEITYAGERVDRTTGWMLRYLDSHCSDADTRLDGLSRAVETNERVTRMTQAPAPVTAVDFSRGRQTVNQRSAPVAETRHQLLEPVRQPARSPRQEPVHVAHVLKEWMGDQQAQQHPATVGPEM